MAIYDDDYPVDRLDFTFSVRTANLLKQVGLKTVGQVRAADDDELLRRPNFGRVSLRELRSIVGTAAAPADDTDNAWQANDHASWRAEKAKKAEAEKAERPWFDFAF